MVVLRKSKLSKLLFLLLIAGLFNILSSFVSSHEELSESALAEGAKSHYLPNINVSESYIYDNFDSALGSEDFTEIWIKEAPVYERPPMPSWLLTDLCVTGGYIYGMFGRRLIGKYNESDLSEVWVKEAPIYERPPMPSCLLTDLCVSGGYIYGMFLSPGGWLIGKYVSGGVITISGEITCEECESGNIYVGAFGANYGELITGEKLNECGPYLLQVPDSYLGQTVFLRVSCDEDSSGMTSIGDYLSFGLFIEELQLTNEDIDFNIFFEITNSIEGEVSCDVYDGGRVYISAWKGRPGTGTPVNTLCPIELDRGTGKGSYKMFLIDCPDGSKVWVSSHWDRDESGYYPLTEGDYLGDYPKNPLILDGKEITGIDLDCCRIEITGGLE